MNYNLFNTIDFLVVPLVLLIITWIGGYIKRKQPSVLQKYFWPAFLLRCFGSLSLSFINEFVYGYGDTYHYYYHAQMMRRLFLNSPQQYFELLFSDPAGGSDVVKNFISGAAEVNAYTAGVFGNTENATVGKIASVFNFICFDSYLGIALFFGLLSFLGCWYIYKTFTHIFPGYEKQFAWLCLFVPSLWFWGSGILKDPLCIFGLGLMVFNFFVKTNRPLKRLLLMGIGAFLLLKIKPYIFYAFSVAVLMGWALYYFRYFNILGKAATLLIFAVAVAVSFPFISSLVQDSFNDVLDQSKRFIDVYTITANAGDATVIPTFDPTPFGFAKLAFGGLVTVFLRPYPWEIKKVVYFLMILENMGIYYLLFLKVKKGPVAFKSNYRQLTNFSFVFFIFLGIIIGVTAFNLGTIARYRVPALPFLFAGIYALKLVRRKRREDKSAAAAAITV